METRSKKRKRQRMMSISSHVSSWPNVPARFESLNDDTLTTVLEFVGNKSYRSFGGLNYHCKEIYLNTEGMTKETFLYGYAPLVAIIDKIERGRRFNQNLYERVGKGVVLFNRRDVLDWALQEKDKLLLRFICNVAAEEGRIDLLEEMWNNVNDEDDKECIFLGVDEYAAQGGKLNVLKWHKTKGLSIDKKRCACEAARHGQLQILEWLQEERGFELSETLYNWANNGGGQLHILKWLREKEVPWDDCIFQDAAYKGNLDVLQWLHDEGCPWPEDDDDVSRSNRVHEIGLKHEVLDWLRMNGYGDRIERW